MPRDRWQSAPRRAPKGIASLASCTSMGALPNSPVVAGRGRASPGGGCHSLHARRWVRCPTRRSSQDGAELARAEAATRFMGAAAYGVLVTRPDGHPVSRSTWTGISGFWRRRLRRAGHPARRSPRVEVHLDRDFRVLAPPPTCLHAVLAVSRQSDWASLVAWCPVDNPGACLHAVLAVSRQSDWASLVAWCPVDNPGACLHAAAHPPVPSAIDRRDLLKYVRR